MVPGAKAPNTYTDEFVLPAGVSARDGEAGVEFVDAKGALLATFSNGVAFDSAPQRAGAPVTARVVPGAPPAPPATAVPSTSPSTTNPSASSSTTAAPAAASSTTSSIVVPSSVAPATTAPLAPPAENVATVEVAVERAWLADPARVFPVAMDPTYTTVATNASDAYGIDTFAWTAAPTTNYGTASALYEGYVSGASEAFVKFNNLVVAPAPTTVVTESHLMLLGGAANNCAKPVEVQGIDATLSAATTWANRPAATGALVSSTTLGANCASVWNTFDTTALARSWITGGAPNNGLRVAPPVADQADAASFKWFWSGNTVNPPLLYITYYLDAPPGSSTPVSPANAAVLATATPVLAATTTTDPDAGVGDVVKYWFRATPAPDAESGARAVDSGWLNSAPPTTACPFAGQVCYVAPVGALTDGVTYYWHVWTSDPFQARAPVGTPYRFRVDLGLGDKGPQPRDGVGPVSANLASGNAVVHAASPSFPTAGGPVGLGYTYNSQAPASTGLTGSYYDDPPANNHAMPALGTPGAMVRVDPTIDHSWGTVGPGLGMSPANFMVRWTGTISAPTGNYTFAADHDDGMKVTIGGVVILTHWTDGAVTNPSEVASPNVAFTVNVAKPITVEYYQSSGSAFAGLSVTVAGAASPTQVPPNWLSPDATITSPVLAPGWTLAPGPLSYASAILGDCWVAFVGTSGALHTYTWVPNGPGYAAPRGEDGVVGMDSTGALTLHAADGVDYAFDRRGQLASATSARDDGPPGSVSSLTYTWTGAKPRLTKISDPGASCDILLTYGPTGSGPCAANTPADALCQVQYWDHTVSVPSLTKLTYDASGQLVRIEDPGASAAMAVVTDFSYTGGHLVSVRSPLAADAVAATAAAVTGRHDDPTDAVRTELAYEVAPVARVTSVTLPAPTFGALRPAHTYTYASATQTIVKVFEAGAARLDRTVNFTRDGAGALTVADIDADGVPTTTIHDAADRLAATIDGAGRRSTVTYDDDALRAQASGRATNTYGPAPTGCFGADNRPNGTCASPPPPHTATTYDTDPAGSVLTGLAATYWPNRTLSGPPVNHGPVAAAVGTLVTADPPAAGMSTRNWSARYTGEVNLDPTGTYGLAVALIGRARLYVDDLLVVEAWSDHATASYVNNTFANSFAGRHRIRVDYAAEADGAPALVLHWTRPGASDAGLPGASLAPRYSVPTRSASDDTTAGSTSRVSDVAYLAMANGLVTEATADRSGANLMSATAYEPAGYRRPVSRTLASGSGSATAYTYYASGEAAFPAPMVPPCPGAGLNQGRALKSTTAADPDGAGPTAALVRTFAYDAPGRVIGSSAAGDWTCTAYDARGRVSTVTVPAYGGEPAHTLNYDWAVISDPTGHPGVHNPLVASVSDTVTVPATATTTITTAVDLLGRVVSYTDAWGNPAQPATGTSYTYDQPGRGTDTAGPAGAMHVGFSAGGRVVAQTLDGAVIASAPLATAYVNGELANATYPSALNLGNGNGTSLSAITRHPTGMTTGLTWTGPGGTLATDAVTRSQSGRVTDETIDGTDANTTATTANPLAQNFLYDTAGRLGKAWSTPTQHLTYSYDPVAGCANANAGKNTDRGATTLNAGTPTTSCYDDADRLLSSTDTAVGTPVYDRHGNTTTLGTQTMVYDGADRHMAQPSPAGPLSSTSATQPGGSSPARRTLRPRPTTASLGRATHPPTS